MGVELAAQSYKRPGLKTNLNSTRTLPKFDETKTSLNTSTASTSSSSTTKSDKSIKYAALSALGNTSRQSIQSGAVRQGGTRFVNPSDYKLRNVDAQLTQSIATGFASTPRSARREADRLNAELQKYVQYVNSQGAYANTGTNKAEGIMSTISMLNQTIGSVTKAVASTKASKPAAVSSNSTPAANLSADSANTLANLSSANTTKELDTGISNLNSKIGTKSKLLEQYQGQIDADCESKTAAEGELATIKENISSTKTSITSTESQITRLQSQIATAQAAGQNVSSLQSQLTQLEQKKQQLENDLKTLEKNQDDKETEISNLDKSIADNTSRKEKTNNELTELKNAQDTYTEKMKKMAKSEEKDLNKSYDKLKKLADKAEKETDETKKQEIIKEYKGIATTYNALVANTTVKGFTPVSEEPNLVDAKGLLAQSGF